MREDIDRSPYLRKKGRVGDVRQSSQVETFTRALIPPTPAN